MKKLMRLLAAVLALTMLCEMLPLAAFAQSDIGQAVTAAVQNIEEENDIAFAGGDGTAENPYQIATAKQLVAVRNDLAAHYVLNNDIDLSGYSSWNPIGDAVYSFSGSFDGNGHVIRNMTIEVQTSDSYLGLFGYASGAKLTNVVLEDATIRGTLSTGNHQVALLVGKTSKTTLSDCTVSGSIQLVANDTSLAIGGIVGQTEGAVIENCVNRAEITLAEESTATYLYCGGIAGSAWSDISACDNYGKITGVSNASIWVGGIVGDGGAVSHCRNYGKVSARSNLETYTVAGIAGRAAVYDSVNYGSVSGYSPVKHGGNAAGIAGQDSYNISNCYNAAAEITSKYGSDYLDSTAYRIGCTNNSVSDVYSLETTKLNGSIPTTDLGNFRRNGASLGRTELGEKIKELFPNDDPFSGMEEEPSKEFEFKKDNPRFLNNFESFFDFIDKTQHFFHGELVKKQWKWFGHADDVIPEAYYTHISSDAYEQLLSGCSKRVRKYVESVRIRYWNGSCYGMAAAAMLNYYAPDRVKLSELDSSAGSMYELTAPANSEKVENFINYYYLMQCLPTLDDFKAERSELYSASLSTAYNEIVAKLQKNVPILAAIYKENGGHAIVLLDIINKDANSCEIRVYDPNEPEEQTMTLYKQLTEWSSIKISYGEYNRMGYHICADELQYLDIRNYFESNRDSFAFKTDYDEPEIIFDSNVDVSGKYGDSYFDTSKKEYSRNVQIHRILSDTDDYSLMQMFFPQSDENAELELSLTDGNDVNVLLEDTLLTISTDGPVKLTYDESARTVDVSADDPTAVSLLMTQNTVNDSWPWHSWAVDTTGTTTLHAELDSEGLHLTGDGLTGAKYATENADTEQTSEGTVNVQPDETGKTSVTIINKNDGDTDDTEVKGEDKAEETTYTVTVSGGTASPAKAKEGETVTIIAEKTDTFQNWTVVAGGITLENENLPTTTFTMGKENVVITANYSSGGNITPPSSGEPGQSPSDDGGAGIVLAIGAAATVAAGIGAIALMPVKVEGKVELADHTALPGAKIALLQNGKVVAQTTTDANGKFALKVKRGSYELTAAYTDANGRLMHKTASFKAPAKNLTVTF
ncbi:MAG TPA: hypothetical protein DCL93_01610 [Faecalibacterium sp.]|nr:hypothetical protein [Faecalibacterium sp.]